jgi:hypothetical protein
MLFMFVAYSNLVLVAYHAYGFDRIVVKGWWPVIPGNWVLLAIPDGLDCLMADSVSLINASYESLFA